MKGDVALRRKGAGLKIDAKFVQADAFMVSQRVFLIILVNPCLSSPSQNVLCYAQVGNMDLEAFIEAAVRKRTSSCVRRFLFFFIIIVRIVLLQESSRTSKIVRRVTKALSATSSARTLTSQKRCTPTAATLCVKKVSVC